MNSHSIRSSRLKIPLVIVLALTLFMGALSASMIEASEDDVKLRGDVVVRPESSTGIGEWKVQGFLEDDEVGALYVILVDEETEIEPPLARKGDTVEVEGLRIGPNRLRAERLKRRSSSVEEQEFEGAILDRPDHPAGIGRWRVRVGTDRILAVIADGGTSFPRGLPGRGEWVELRVRPLPDGSFLLLRMRLDRFEEDQIVVRLRPGIKPHQLVERRKLQLIRSVLPSANIHLFSAREGDDHVDDLIVVLNATDRDLVVWAEFNYAGGIPEGNPYDTWAWSGETPDDYVSQSAFEQIRWPGIAELYDGEGLVVAVIDTGVSHSHPLLVPRLVPGRDLVDDDLLADEEPGGVAWGHGTHVAGIITRLAPQSRIMPFRVLNPQGRGNSFVVAYAIELAVTAGADVINLSLGTDVDSRILRETVAWAASQNVLMVAAAGNLNSETVQYPAAYAEVISVTGVDGENRKADFASYGAQWIGLAAPSVGITSTIIGPQGPGYAVWSGTSMAASFVSGASLLGRQKYPDLPAGQLAALLVERATDIDALNPEYIGKLGGGLLNLESFLAAVGFDHRLFLPQVESLR